MSTWNHELSKWVRDSRTEVLACASCGGRRYGLRVSAERMASTLRAHANSDGMSLFSAIRIRLICRGGKGGLSRWEFSFFFLFSLNPLTVTPGRKNSE